MKQGGFRPGAGGRKRGKTPAIELPAAEHPDPTQYANALEWGMARLNDPTISDELKYRICAVLLPFQMPRLEAHRIGKKELQAQAAQEPAADFEPGTTPRLVRRKDN
jgi:hypothetical protein